MKAIHADPKELRKIFAEKYIVPDFQRPYSWENEHCDKLWEDFIEFYESKRSKEDRYFLGNIVIHPTVDSFSVIDGQQRLTTLILLIKCLHSRAGTALILEECLKIKDPLTSQLTDELRLDSHVIDDDKKNLYDIIFNNGDNTGECKMKANYIHLGLKIDEWWKINSNSTVQLDRLILCLLDQVVMLPIHCGSEDDALTIFETINNRGMSLGDADIFKAKLHSAAKDESDVFVQRWAELSNPEWLFRVLMHVGRAKDNESGREIALRSYFTEKNKYRLSDWKSVMNSLKMISCIESDWAPAPKIVILRCILSAYPNYYWNFPLYVFLQKYGTFDGDEFSLSKDRVDEFLVLLEQTVKYFYIKGVVYNSVNAVKDTVFKVCVAIEQKADYISEYQKYIDQNDKDDFHRKLNAKQYGRYLKGIVLLSAYLNPAQDLEAFKNFIIRTYHIEHILPKKWNNYDGWNDATWWDDLNKLGNLIPLEYRLNIKAKNEFFDKKRESYLKSDVEDARDLCNLTDWTVITLQAKQDEKLARLTDFFGRS